MSPSMFDEKLKPYPPGIRERLESLPLEVRLRADELHRNYRASPSDDPARVWEACIAEATNPVDARAPKAEKPPKEKPKLQGREVSFPDIEPWPDLVDGSALLNELAKTFLRFLALPHGAVGALTLWAVHAHAHDLSEVSPILVIKSPAMRCGKTTALEVIHALIPRPLMASNLTGPVVFRIIEQHHPALLIDEADSFVTRNEELRGILNSGHRRKGATSIRLVGETHEPRVFSTWSPKAIASIGSLAATLEDRSVTIPMRRKAKGERVEKLRRDRLGELDPIGRRAARWIADHADELRAADPEVPESLDDRASDNWRPLLAIADLAGGKWPSRARKAALTLSLGRVEETGIRIELLSDISVVWKTRATDRMPSEELVAALVGMKDRPWAEWSRGRPLSQSGLARLLKGFGIGSKDIRFPEGPKKGYDLSAFADTFSRYVPERRGTVAGAVAPLSRFESDGLPAPGLECRGVAVQTALREHGDAWEPKEGAL